jgi:hypothetical protein
MTMFADLERSITLTLLVFQLWAKMGLVAIFAKHSARVLVYLVMSLLFLILEVGILADFVISVELVGIFLHLAP